MNQKKEIKGEHIKKHSAVQLALYTINPPSYLLGCSLFETIESLLSIRFIVGGSTDLDSADNFF